MTTKKPKIYYICIAVAALLGCTINAFIVIPKEAHVISRVTGFPENTVRAVLLSFQ